MTETAQAQSEMTVTEMVDKIDSLEKRLDKVEKRLEKEAAAFINQEKFDIKEAKQYLLQVHGIRHQINTLYRKNVNGELVADSEPQKSIWYKRETLDEYAKRRGKYRKPEVEILVSNTGS